MKLSVFGEKVNLKSNDIHFNLFFEFLTQTKKIFILNLLPINGPKNRLTLLSL
jgi:hypothetical protein